MTAIEERLPEDQQSHTNLVFRPGFAWLILAAIGMIIIAISAQVTVRWNLDVGANLCTIGGFISFLGLMGYALTKVTKK